MSEQETKSTKNIPVYRNPGIGKKKKTNQKKQAVKLTKDTECSWESAQDITRLKMVAE